MPVPICWAVVGSEKRERREVESSKPLKFRMIMVADVLPMKLTARGS